MNSIRGIQFLKIVPNTIQYMVKLKHMSLVDSKNSSTRNNKEMK